MTGLLERAKELKTTRLKHLPGQHDQGAHGHGGGDRPRWAGDKAAEYDGVKVYNGKFGATKDKWAVDKDGQPTPWRNTPAEAVVHNRKIEEAAAVGRQGAERANDALSALRRGDLSPELVMRYVGSELVTTRAATAIAREWGLSVQQAKKVVGSLRLMRETSMGAFLYDPQELIKKLQRQTNKEERDPIGKVLDGTGYHRVGDASLQRCATCRHFTESGRCDLYDFKADEQYTCDSWRPNIEALRAARSQTIKEVSATPTAAYAHGPGGLFSPAGLSGNRKHGVVNADITNKAADAPMKTEQDGRHPASHYLVVEDTAKPSTWHLRVRGVDGELDRRLMGAAYAALTVGYRGNKYAGPDKAKALAKLRRLYAEVDAPLPGEAVTTKPGGKSPGPSIKNPKVYEALLKQGMSKSQAAAISNAMAKRGKKEYTASEKEKFDKASTQLDMPNVIKGKALQFARSIAKDDLHEDGVERDTHVTVKYGIANNTLERVKQIASRFGPITLKFGRVSLFKRPEEGFDVVKVEIESPELRSLNKAIGALPNADTRKGYNPHLTIAYVKSGTGKKYTGNGPLMGDTVTVETLQFSDKDGKKTAIKLAGETQAETTKHVSHDQKTHGARHGVGGLREFANGDNKLGIGKRTGPGI